MADPLASVRQGVELASDVAAIRAKRAAEVASQHAAMQRRHNELEVSTSTVKALLYSQKKRPVYSDGYNESAVLGSPQTGPRRIELDWRGEYIPTRFPDLHRRRAQEPLVWPDAAIVHDCLAIVQRGGILALHGTRGGGKTQLALDLALAAERHPAYFTAARLFHYRKQWWAIKKHEEEYNVELLNRLPLLVIDEIHERVRNEYDDRFLTQLVDRRYGEQMPTVLISNLQRAEFETHLGESVVSRVGEFGAFVNITWGSFRAVSAKEIA